MIKDLLSRNTAYRLQEYVIIQNNDGEYEYFAWDFKGEKPTWIKGQTRIIDDVLGLCSITDDGEETEIDNLFELNVELGNLPEWEKTKYVCAVLATQQAVLPRYCGTGKPVKHGGEEFKNLSELLAKHGVQLMKE